MRIIWLIFIVVWVASCAEVGHLRPEQRNLEDTNWHRLPELTERIQAGDLNRQWWLDFNDPKLTELVENVLKSNYDIRIAAGRTQTWRKNARASTLAQFPRLTVEAGYQDERRSLDHDDFPITERNVQSYNAALVYDWELDVFTRVHKQAQMDEALYQSELADQRAVQSMLVADTVRAYIRYRSAQLQEVNAESQLQRHRQRHRLREQLQQQGSLTELELLASAAEYSGLKNALFDFEMEKLQALYDLQMLVGGESLSQYLADHPMALPSVPEAVALSSMTDILQQRPDVVAAQHRLHAAVARYQIQHSLWWPRISIHGSVGYLSTDFSGLGRDGSETKLFNPSLQWSALNLLSLKAKLASVDADAKVRLLEYESTVTGAINELHLALRLFSINEKRVQADRAQARETLESAGLINMRFQQGVGNQLDVYVSEDIRDRAISVLIASEQQLLLRLVDVYRAVGI